MNETTLRPDPVDEQTPAPRSTTNITPVAPELSPQSILDRLSKSLVSFQKAATRLEQIEFRANMKTETGKAMSIGTPPAGEKFFPALERITRSIERQAERIEESSGHLHELF